MFLVTIQGLNMNTSIVSNIRSQKVVCGMVLWNGVH